MILLVPKVEDSRGDTTTPVDTGNGLLVKVRREPFSSTYLLTLSDGTSEEIDAVDALEWFKRRGADMRVVEKALDYAWNFYQADILISNPKSMVLDQRVKPRL
jgi:hypothetical protein